MQRKFLSGYFIREWGCQMDQKILIAALTHIVAKKAYIGYDAVEWLEGWIMDVKDPPDQETIKAIEEAIEPVKPKRATSLYRGFNQGKYKTIKAMMKAEFGKVLKEGDSIELDSKDYVSWTKNSGVARDLCYQRTSRWSHNQAFSRFHNPSQDTSR